MEKRCFKRVETPADIVGTAVFLASADSDFVTGQTIAVGIGDFFGFLHQMDRCGAVLAQSGQFEAFHEIEHLQ